MRARSLALVGPLGSGETFTTASPVQRRLVGAERADEASESAGDPHHSLLGAGPTQPVDRPPALW